MNDYTKLHVWLKTDTNKIFKDFKKYTLDYKNKTKRRIFMDNGSNILFVAHADTVLRPSLFSVNNKRIYAQGLDDRLGCYIAYSLSQLLGADLLITDLEETGKSTAKWHKPKEYNWVAEFDRAGDDVVAYTCGSTEMDTLLKKNWKIGRGSFSDICVLNTKACCFNLGIGYEKAHSADSYMVKETTAKQIALFRKFYDEHKNTKLIRDENYGASRWKTNSYNYTTQSFFWSQCEICETVFCKKVYQHFICETCLEGLLEDRMINEYRKESQWLKGK